MAVVTIPQLFLHAVRHYRKENAFLYKKDGSYASLSHEEALRRVHHGTLGLRAIELVKGDRVALLSESRLEWAITDLAILSAQCINVPIYSTLPPNQIAYILKDSEAKAVFVSDLNQLAKILEIRRNLPALQQIISFDPKCNEPGVLTLERLLEIGAALPDPVSYEELISTIGMHDWASIIYTSGTTGDPKGAILTHWNLVSNVITCGSIVGISPDDIALSFLPLSHVLERMAGYYTMLHGGATIAYAESIDSISQNLIEIRPTVMVCVPRVLEKMYARIMDSVTSSSLPKKSLFFWALNVGRTYISEKLSGRFKTVTKWRYALADRLVFSKLRDRMGGRLRFCFSGGAPLHREIAEFFHGAGLPVFEGYGLTETSPTVTLNTPDAFKFGTVGKPIPDVEVKIAEDGEILVKGPNVMAGYFKKPEMTHDVMDGEWFRTGDLGSIDQDGFLVITDRKKDIIVTAGGKNVAPQPIENTLKSSKYISQAVLIGNKRKFISALIVPNFDNLKRYARAVNIPYTDIASLIKHPKAIEKISTEIERKSRNFASFEKVKKFVLLEHDFSIDCNELTPSLKVRRTIVEEEFKEQIDELYEE